MLRARPWGSVRRALYRRFASRRDTRATRRVMSTAAAWDGSGTQEDLMYRDECILVDEKDAIVGHDTCFLFNARNELLLQQRAASKITFPSLWTNTCCSHPLYGYEPTEVDTDEDIAAGTVPGAKRAAVCKLQHELGIAPEQVPISKFKYLTRLHYCAADEFAEDQAMSGGPWGEHEMDYILFIKPDADVTFQPNPEEIDDAKWVTREELREMMDPASGLRWSPWFRIIAEKFLDTWWAELDETLGTDKHVDLETIHEVM